MTRLALQQLCRSFGSVPAVRDFSLDVADGRLLCLLGPSGSGKTTTMRMVAGLETPDSGEIHMGDRDVTHLEPRDRNIGMMFQGYALYPHLSIRDNIAYPLRVRGVARPERDARVAEVASLLSIDTLLDRSVRQISGGQQQRVALARAIVQRPALFLLDEPISNLDAVLRRSMRGEIKRIQKMLGTTMVVVTHDQLDGLAMADEIAIMREGSLQQVGTPDEVFDRPANTFVAGFIGDPQMNLLAGAVERQDGQVGVRVAGHWLRPANGVSRALEESQTKEVVVGIRPRAVRIHRQPAGDRQPAGGLIPAEVYVATPEGSRAIYEFQLDGDRFKVETEPEVRLAMGEKTFLELRSEALHIFAASSGEGRRLG
ncbi:MAG: ABC transporter ATP-binding protein [Chloroflexota bacterium]